MKKTVIYGLVLAGVITNAMAEGSTLDVSGLTLDTSPVIAVAGVILTALASIWAVYKAIGLVRRG